MPHLLLDPRDIREGTQSCQPCRINQLRIIYPSSKFNNLPVPFAGQILITSWNWKITFAIVIQTGFASKKTCTPFVLLRNTKVKNVPG
jgi:hypothetical protein